MSINVSGNVLSTSGFTSSGEIANYPNIVTDGLVLWYDAGNNASYVNSSSYYDCGYGCQYYASSPGCTNCNTQIKDMSGYGYDGSFTSTTVSYDNTGGRMYFNGSSYVTIGTNAAYASPSNITLDFWAYPTTTSSYQYLISNARDCCGTYYGYEMWFNLGTPSFQIWNGTSAGVSAGTTVPLNQYVNIVGTYNGSVLNIYVNGTLSGTTNTTLGIGASASFTTYLGRMGMSSAYALTGYISTARIYNRALTDVERLQNFNDGRRRFGL